MSTGRILVAGIAGGIAVFIWGAVSHMVLPIGDMGVRSLPAEPQLLPAMRTAIPERGFYFFPGMEEGQELTAEAQKAWEEKYRAGPRGILIFDPTGGEAMSSAQLGTELLSNILAALVVALVLARIPSLAGRIGMGLALGVFAWLSIDVSYWNWYRFPHLFAAAQFIDQAAGWLLGGAVVAMILPRARATAPSSVQVAPT